MSQPHDLCFCLGSACFARGATELVSIAQEYVANRGLDAQVTCRGEHCTERCDRGPVVNLGDQTYLRVTAERLVQILDRLGRATSLPTHHRDGAA